MDFFKISVNIQKNGPPAITPDWTIDRSKDLMIRGKSFYAIWDENRGLWSTDEYDVPRLVDAELYEYAKNYDGQAIVKDLRSFQTNSWATFRKFIQNVSDNSHQLDAKLIFANTDVKKTDYASKRLPYALKPGPCDSWNELLSVLYSEEERDKIEWAIGSVVSGDSKFLQKFFVFYGSAGTGKSTVLNIIQKLFVGYASSFDAKALSGNNNAFATEVFKSNPLVAIQHDGDLSRIEDNTKLNSIVSHEEMTMNEKYKPSYSAHINALLFMGTNQPVKISDAKSGIIRRLIDIHPTGAKIENDRYNRLIKQVDFELGAIAYQCLKKYETLGRKYYNNYRPLEMMLQTDVFYNFVESVFDIFKKQDGVSLKQAYVLYKEFCVDTGIDKILPQYKVREELRNYFDSFDDRVTINGVQIRSYYSGFKNLSPPNPNIPDTTYLIDFNSEVSYLDRLLADMPAQYAKSSGFPGLKWENVTTKLSDLKTKKLHFVKVSENHVVIDFDLVDENGDKDLQRNLVAASKWPPTYAELSKSGAGIHLHYFYTGDVTELSSIFDVGIEVKTLLGGASLRRKLSKCNALEISTLTSGLPLKEKSMLDNKNIKSEKSLRDLIDRNLRKEIHPGTKSSIDFIHKILEEAYESGMSYDVRDLRSVILSFASTSTNQSSAAIKTVQSMQFVSKDALVLLNEPNSSPIVFFDVEVYSNLFIICWKFAGDSEVVRMVNPSPEEIEPLFGMKLVGFNNRRYDNHILYARFLGYTNEELYKLSQKIIANNDKALFGEAYNISYADIYDFSSKKQGLKKFQIELGIHHLEMDHPWDEAVPEEKWPMVIDYCVNDVCATEAVFNSRKQDFIAREILANLSGLSVNHTTQNHTAKIIFGEEKNPQKSFVYTKLNELFDGYRFDGAKESTYRGEVTGEGGYVYAEPGIYENVALLDVASMHPTSIELLNLFGPYTSNFSALKEARMAIKHKEYDKARKLLDGKLEQFLQDDSDAEALSYALKIVINIVYGLTSAQFPNAFRDNRNIDNIVAKRGALFMIDLKHAVQELGFTVAHIKTDSIKIPDSTPEIIKFVTDFGKKYGYDFEHETTYEKMCLINDAVYIAKSKDKWVAVGAQFQHPYVLKTLFTKEDVLFDDYCETRSVVQGIMYLDFNEDSLRKVLDFKHVGRTGSFVPVLDNGGTLWRIKDDHKYAVTGTKGYRWVERDVALDRYNNGTLNIDMSYFERLKNNAEEAIEYYGSYARFVENT